MPKTFTIAVTYTGEDDVAPEDAALEVELALMGQRTLGKLFSIIAFEAPLQASDVAEINSDMQDFIEDLALV